MIKASRLITRHKTTKRLQHTISANKRLRQFSRSLIASLCIGAITHAPLHAQVSAISASDLAAAAANAAKNAAIAIKKAEDAQRKTLALPTPDEKFADIANLKAVQITSPFRQADMQAYWADSIGKAVTGERINDFKSWAWTSLRADGYLAYVTVNEEKSVSGSTLVINVSAPMVRKITVAATQEDDTVSQYAENIALRFARSIKTGDRLDIAALDAQITGIKFDVPVELDIDITQVNATEVDVIVNVRPSDANKYPLGLVQLNNYGLKQYGEWQALTNVRWAGFTPLSEVSFTGQGSDRSGYLKGEYEAPLTGTGIRAKIWASGVKTSTINTQGFTQDVGVGLNRLMWVGRQGTLKAGLEAAQRLTTASVDNIGETSNIQDKQLRLRAGYESSQGVFDRTSHEVVLVQGDLSLDRNADSLAQDTLNYRTNGLYNKVEVNGSASKTWGEDRAWSASARWKGQYAHKNLDGYNKQTLGGPNGIRAYGIQDGAGDLAAQASFDLTRQLNEEVYAGVLYDAGFVQTYKTPLTGSVNPHGITLQGAGVQIGGQKGKVSWNLSIAKSFGMNQDRSADPTLTPVGDTRAYFSLTYSF